MRSAHGQSHGEIRERIIACISQKQTSRHHWFFITPLAEAVVKVGFTCGLGLGFRSEIAYWMSRAISVADNVLFGYELPMPRVDLFIALATVAGFLPAVVAVHHLVAFVIRRLPKLGAAQKQD